MNDLYQIFVVFFKAIVIGVDLQVSEERIFVGHKIISLDKGNVIVFCNCFPDNLCNTGKISGPIPSPAITAILCSKSTSAFLITIA